MRIKVGNDFFQMETTLLAFTMPFLAIASHHNQRRIQLSVMGNFY